MKKFFSAVWRIIKSNWLLKIMSVLFAVILWSYVLSETNPLRTRDVADVTVRYSHMDELVAKNLAISGSLSEILDSVDVRVEVQQSDLKYVNNTNIFADVDLSKINGTGEHVLNITATSSYGEAVNVTPSKVTLQIDTLVTKIVPVTVRTVGTVPNGYYAVSPVINPEIVPVTGARAYVEKVVSSVCTVNLNGLTEGYTQSIELDLLDKDGNILDKNMFTGTIPSVIVNLEILAKKTVPVNTSSMLLGEEEIAEGYEVSGITVDPVEVDIIGKKSILDKIDFVEVLPISVSGISSDIVTLLDFKLPDGVSLLTEGQVQVYIDIKEIVEVKLFDGVPIELKNLPKGLKASLDIDTVDVTVIAGINQLKLLFKENILAYVDLDGLGEGTHELNIILDLPEGFADENVSSVVKKVIVVLTR